MLSDIACLPYFILFSVVKTISPKLYKRHKETYRQLVLSLTDLIKSFKSELITMSVDDLSEKLSELKESSELGEETVEKVLKLFRQTKVSMR